MENIIFILKFTIGGALLSVGLCLLALRGDLTLLEKPLLVILIMTGGALGFYVSGLLLYFREVDEYIASFDKQNN